MLSAKKEARRATLRRYRERHREQIRAQKAAAYQVRRENWVGRKIYMERDDAAWLDQLAAAYKVTTAEALRMCVTWARDSMSD